MGLARAGAATAAAEPTVILTMSPQHTAEFGGKAMPSIKAATIGLYSLIRKY